VTIRHLLTHVSGLPDQPANNHELRKRNAALSEFAEAAIRTQLEEMVSCEMEGAAPESGSGDSQAKELDWNCRYSRPLGAPWGGTHASAPDVVKFLDEFVGARGKIVKPETARSVREERDCQSSKWRPSSGRRQGRVQRRCRAARIRDARRRAARMIGHGTRARWFLFLPNELQSTAHLFRGSAIFPAGPFHLDVFLVDDGKSRFVHVLVLLRIEVAATDELEDDLVLG
jgi:hypothetical protein